MKNQSTISLKKELNTKHYPLTVAEGLDKLLAPKGYKRLQEESNSEMFIWENEQHERFMLDYYTSVDAITHACNMNLSSPEASKKIENMYTTLRNTIGVLNSHIGYPFVSATRTIVFGIEGSNPEQKAEDIQPLIKELYSKQEGVKAVGVETLDQTDESIYLLFEPLEEALEG